MSGLMSSVLLCIRYAKSGIDLSRECRCQICGETNGVDSILKRYLDLSCFVPGLDLFDTWA
eukprot:473200-Rhodomonas_salina.2